MKSPHINHPLPILILLILTAVLGACRPKGILHSGEMRRVLVDLHKADAVIQVSGMQYGHNEALNIYYAEVLEKHGITQAQFDSSIVWYTDHPLLFDKIYPKVQADLKAEHEAFQKAYADELNYHPHKNIQANDSVEFILTPARFDSILWVTQHGLPTTWRPYIPPYNGPER